MSFATTCPLTEQPPVFGTRHPSSMRILQLVQKPQRRGAEVFAFELNAWLRSRAHQVRTVYLYPYQGDRPLPIFAGDTVGNGIEDSSLEFLPGVHPRLLRQVRRELLKFAPDVVQLNGGRTMKYGAALARLAPSRRWLLVYRNIDSPVFWARGYLRRNFYRRLVMSQMDGVIGVSDTTLEEARQFYKFRAPSVSIPNGVDLTALRPTVDRAALRRQYHTPTSATVLLFIGNLGRQKRPDRFLQVVAAICRKRSFVYAWLLGDGPYREEGERLAAELGIAEKVRFLGYQTDVASFVAAGDVNVSTSDTEGIPAVVIEAGYLNLPTVGFRVGGMHECIKDGQTGILVPAGNEAALADALLRLIDSSRLRQQMGQEAQRWIVSRFSIDSVGRRYEAFYAGLVDRFGSRQ